jgi:hypothetical protein
VARPKISTSGGAVALVLAASLGFGFNMFCFAVLYDAITGQTALSENATQVLTGWGGGIIGVLGSYIGYRVGVFESNRVSSDPPDTISDKED